MKPALLRLGLVLGAVLFFLGAAAGAPHGLRRMDSFLVRNVEVVGTRHLSPRAAIAAAGITSGSNVFADPAPWLAALQRHPLVADARIERRVPDGLILHIREAVPIALARTPELRPVDDRGVVLPADLAADDMDLPVFAVDTRMDAEGRAVDEPTRRLARFVATLTLHEPSLLGWISELDVAGSGVRVTLRNATGAEVLLPAQPTPARLRELRVTLVDLATPRALAAGDSTAVPAETELSRVKRIDGRWHDQIVVALEGKS